MSGCWSLKPVKEDLVMLITDEPWDQIRDLLPGKPGDLGRFGKNNRLFVDAVLYFREDGDPVAGSPRVFWKLEHHLATI